MVTESHVSEELPGIRPAAPWHSAAEVSLFLVRPGEALVVEPHGRVAGHEGSTFA